MIAGAEPAADVAAALAGHDAADREALLRLRTIIVEEAAAPEIGGVVESLKWGQPSYAPPRKVGTPVRLGLGKTGEPALLVHCGTTLIADWTAARGAGDRVEGARALIVARGAEEDARAFIRAALTYRRR